MAAFVTVRLMGRVLGVLSDVPDTHVGRDGGGSAGQTPQGDRARVFPPAVGLSLGLSAPSGSECSSCKLAEPGSGRTAHV